MSIRYYNLKVGSELINGTVIRVNLNFDLENRINELIIGKKLRFLGAIGNSLTYKLHLNDLNQAILFSLYSNGEIRVKSKPKNTGVYLKQINEQIVNKLISSSSSWKSKQDYIGFKLI